MGIYNSGTESVKLGSLPKKELFLLALALAVLVFLLFLASVVSEALKPPVVSAGFLSDLDLSKGPEQQNTVLRVRIFNSQQETVQGFVLNVLPVSDSLIVFPSSVAEKNFGAGEIRQYDFIVRPNPLSKISTGTYKLNIFLSMDGQKIEQEVSLSVKTV